MNHSQRLEIPLKQHTRYCGCNFKSSLTYKFDTFVSLLLLFFTLCAGLLQILVLVLFYDSMIATITVTVIAFVTSFLQYWNIAIEYNMQKRKDLSKSKTCIDYVVQSIEINQMHQRYLFIVQLILLIIALGQVITDIFDFYVVTSSQ